MSTKSYSPKAGEIKRTWRVIDVSGKPLGRVASEIARLLRGKDKPAYTPHADTGDFVIVVNAGKVRLTGSKLQEKTYYSHSMYPGGLKAISAQQMIARHPRRIIEYAVWGMLPKNRLGRKLMRKLKVYAEATHPHMAQTPELAHAPKPGRTRAKPPRKAKAVKAAPVAAEAPVKARPEAPAPARAAPEPAAAEPAPQPAAQAKEPVVAAAAEPAVAPVAEKVAAAAAEAAPQPAGAAAEPAPVAPEAGARPAVSAEEPPPIRRATGQPRSRKARAQRERGAKKPGATEGPAEGAEQAEVEGSREAQEE